MACQRDSNKILNLNVNFRSPSLQITQEFRQKRTDEIHLYAQIYPSRIGLKTQFYFHSEVKNDSSFLAHSVLHNALKRRQVPPKSYFPNCAKREPQQSNCSHIREFSTPFHLRCKNLSLCQIRHALSFLLLSLSCASKCCKIQNEPAKGLSGRE